MLANEPGIVREVPSGIEQGGDPRKEKDDVERQIQGGLQAWPHRTVKKITADMPVLRERVGAAHHEQGSVEHVGGVENPGRRRVQNVALEDLDADHGGQDDDQPGKCLAAPSANVVDEKKETLDWHWIGPAQGDERIRR